MIKLILTPDTQPIIYTYEKNKITIGKVSDQPLIPDLLLCGFSQLEGYEEPERDVLITIYHNGSDFVVENTLNDPFASLNGRPFNKKILVNGDVLQLQRVLIHIQAEYKSLESEEETFTIENKPASFKEQLMKKTEELELAKSLPPSGINLEAAMDKLESILNNKKKQPDRPSQKANNHKAQLPIISKKPEDISKLYELLSENKPKKEPLPVVNQPIEEKNKAASPPRISIKENLNDDSEGLQHEPKAPKVNLSPFLSLFSWKTLVSVIVSLTFLISALAGSLYLAISEHNEEEQIRAAQVIADVAMAMNFAQIHHNLPPNQNWSDPDFLKQNLNAVLAPGYHPFAKVDSLGHFLDSSYILRVYTGDDPNHFLVIAQPSPNMLQWALPKAAIAFDSHFMELRKISDLKELNRLLVNATIDKSNGEEIDEIVLQGELISLNDLSTHELVDAGFRTPEDLPLISPGAENLVYNALRYYPLGETLIARAVALYNNEETDQDLLPLIDEISRYSKFPNIVLYSSGGVQSALKGQKALSTFFPNHNFLFGYIPANSSTGHLIKIDDHEEIADLNPMKSPKSLEDLSEAEDTIIAINKTPPLDTFNFYTLDTIDHNHPLYYKLAVLNQAKEHALKLISKEIEKEKISSHLDANDKIAQLKSNFEAVDIDMRHKIIKAIIALQREYAAMPCCQFMNYVQAADLELALETHLQEQIENEYIPLIESYLDSKMLKIQESNTLAELGSALNDAIGFINLENFPDPKELTRLQNLTRSNVLERLDALLLKAEPPISDNELHADSKEIISHILKNCRVVDNAEIDYYLSEFDFLKNNRDT